jgi:hypothetical protein
VTQEEFEIEWCAKTGFEPSVFKSGKRIAVRCYCGGNGCHGWRSLINDPDRLQEHAESDGRPDAQRT